MQVVTCYCPPKRRSATDKPPAEERRGLSPELAAYGFAKKCSPALEEEVSRAAAFYPSFEVAQRELGLRGRKMNVKEIRRISMQCGEGMLVLRRQMVESFFRYTEAGLEISDNVMWESVFPKGKRTRSPEISIG